MEPSTNQPNGTPLYGYTPNMVGATILPTPEEEAEKKRKEEEKAAKKGKLPVYLIIIIVLLAVLTVGFGIYTIVDLARGHEKCVECEICADENASTVQVLNFEFESTAVLYNGEVYVNINGTSSQFNSLYGDGTYDLLTTIKENYETYTFGNSSVNLDNDAFTGMKLNAKNVTAIFDYEQGQDVNRNYGLLLLYDDGTLGYIQFSDLIAGEIDVTILTDLTDIINVISRQDFSGINTYAITRSGTDVRLSIYISSIAN